VHEDKVQNLESQYQYLEEKPWIEVEQRQMLEVIMFDLYYSWFGY